MTKKIVKVSPSAPANRMKATPAAEIIRRELKVSIKLSLFGVYSLGIFLLGGVYLNSQNSSSGILEKELLTIEQSKKELKEFVTELKSQNRPDRWIRENNGILEQRIVDAIKEREGSRDSIIDEQQKKISYLKGLIKKNIDSEKVNRTPASTQGKTLSYSHQNYEVLLYEHRIKVKRFQEEQSQSLKSLIAILDLSQEADLKKLENFKDKQKVELFAYRKSLEAQRTDFRKKQYIVLR